MFKKLITGAALIGMIAVSSGPAMAAETGVNKKHGEVDLTNVITNDMVSALSDIQYASDTGGGTWDYGTSVAGLTTKKVWSNYNHPNLVHKSSCQIGTTFNSSEWKNPKSTSYSSATGGMFADTKAWWDVK
ncbi:TPA: hypothetical protein ROY20_005677 [Bacillus cereus]|nr:hypothetical protein [Bacillus cereus]